MADGDVRVPAGWYPDPLGLPQLRWWDNHAWTEYTSDARQPMVAETLTQQARLAYADDDDDLLTRRERREREREAEVAAEPALMFAEPEEASDGAAETIDPGLPATDSLLQLEAPVRDQIVEEELSPAAKFADFVPTNAPSTPAYQLDSRFDDLLGDTLSAQTFAFPDLQTPVQPLAQPAAQPVQVESTTTTIAGGVVVTGSTSTPGAWIIAMIPIVALVINMFFLLSDLAGRLDGFAPAILLGGPYIIGILLAYLDWAQLKRKGYTRIAHWTFAFGSPAVYLIARSIALVRLSGRGWGPLLTTVLLAAVNVASIVAVPGLIISLDPPTFSAQVESSVQDQAKAFGSDISVNCPSAPPTIVGQSFTCIAQTNDDAPVQWPVPVSLQRSSVWYTWQVNDWGIYSLQQTKN